MSPRKQPSKAAAARHQLPPNKGVVPAEFFAKRRADAMGSSQMGEREEPGAAKVGMGNVRREERKQARLEEGKLNRAFERQVKIKRKEV